MTVPTEHRPLIRQCVIVECEACGYVQEFRAATVPEALALASDWVADPEQDYALCPDCAGEVAEEERNVLARMCSAGRWHRGGPRA